MADSDTTLTITGADTSDGTVAVDVLMRILEGMQQLSLIMAAYSENVDIRHRFKPSRELRARYQLRCGIPSKGSYVIPLELTDSRSESIIQTESILPEVFRFVEAARTGNRRNVTQVISDSQYLERALLTLRSFAPKRGEGWHASLGSPDGKAVSLNGNLTKRINQILLPPPDESLLMTVTGELIEVNFIEYTLIIRYPPTGKEIKCSYQSELEVELFKSRRDLIQVTGEFVLDANGDPKTLTNVSRIDPLDLSEIIFDSIEQDGRILNAQKPLHFQPELDAESKQTMTVSHKDLDLEVVAYDRDSLINEISSHLFFAWDNYAKSNDSELTIAARNLSKVLREYFSEEESESE